MTKQSIVRLHMSANVNRTTFFRRLLALSSRFFRRSSLCTNYQFRAHPLLKKINKQKNDDRAIKGGKNRFFFTFTALSCNYSEFPTVKMLGTRGQIPKQTTKTKRLKQFTRCVFFAVALCRSMTTFIGMQNNRVMNIFFVDNAKSAKLIAKYFRNTEWSTDLEYTAPEMNRGETESENAKQHSSVFRSRRV